MSRHFIISTITFLLSMTALQPAAGQSAREYTKDRPLIIVSDWEFPPYEFRNDKGEPDGFNVEILNIILDQLKIPHKFIMQEWYQCTKTFESREADLIHALTVNYRKRPYIMTQNLITYYSVKSVRRPSQEPLRLVSQIKDDDTIMVKNNDYVPLRLKQEYDPQFHMEYRSPKEALSAIRSGRNSYYIWGAIPLQMKIKEYHLDSLVLDDINIPAGELRFIGYDKDHNPKYGAVRSTTGSFKGDIKGSDKRFAFRIVNAKKPRSVYVFEAAIDLLSFATLEKQFGEKWYKKSYLSLAGIGNGKTVPKALEQFLKDYPNISHIHLLLDSDEPGRIAAQNIKAALEDRYIIKYMPPPNGKDYNEFLQFKNAKGKQPKPIRR